MRALLLLTGLAAAGCVQSTGGNLVTFAAEAVGTDAARSFVSGRGYDVTLSRARLLVGAVYLNQSNPADHTLETTCFLPGVYSGEVRSALVIDALSGAAQPFETAGNGTDAPVRAAELWLTDGDVNEPGSDTVVLDVAGVATRAGVAYPFSAAFTIGENRQQPPRDDALPGSHPICRERIVTPIPAELTLAQGGTLRLGVDPRAWFASVEFAELKGGVFADDLETAGQPDLALYHALRAAKGPYRLEWRSP